VGGKQEGSADAGVKEEGCSSTEPAYWTHVVQKLCLGLEFNGRAFIFILGYIGGTRHVISLTSAKPLFSDLSSFLKHTCLLYDKF